MTSLTTRCRDEFEPAVRARGESYARQGRVRLRGVDTTGAAGQVSGSQGATYLLALDWSEAAVDGVVLASCSCPYFADGTPCKHLWAALVLLDERGAGADVGGRGPLCVEDYETDIDGSADDDEDRARAVAPVERAAGRPPPVGPAAPARSSSNGRARGSWREKLFGADSAAAAAWSNEVIAREPVGDLRVWYAMQMGDAESIVVDLFTAPKGDIAGGKLKTLSLTRGHIDWLPDPADRDILLRVVGEEVESVERWTHAGSDRSGPFSRIHLRSAGAAELILKMAATGRLGMPVPVSRQSSEFMMLRHEAEPPWVARVEAVAPPDGGEWRIDGQLIRGDAAMSVGHPAILAAGGFLVHEGVVARVEFGGCADWMTSLRRYGPIRVPVQDREAFLDELYRRPLPTALVLPDELRLIPEVVRPRPALALRKAPFAPGDRLAGRITFRYGGRAVRAADPVSTIADPGAGTYHPRDTDFERTAREPLGELGFRDLPHYRRDTDDVEVARRHLLRAVEALAAAGWDLEVEGRRYRMAGTSKLRVTGGVDWLDLKGTVNFDGIEAGLAEVLDALGRGDGLVPLTDGSRGVLNADWRERCRSLLDFGVVADGSLRFRPFQAVLLDSLLEAGAASRDTAFRQLTERLGRTERALPMEPPAGFVGALRDYQKLGLGWLRMLRELKCGGCLADDMGLGKTVQVLAALEERRTRRLRPREARHPSLVVVPRSLVENWLREAARFTPALRVLDYTGLDRQPLRERFASSNLVVTTYGTVRRDIQELVRRQWDYVILDEAQAVKNPASQAAKAVRLLEGTHRLALSGTPVENRLAELGSLFEFLNPGMFGSAATARTRILGNTDDASLARLRRGLAPFLLRRTKEQVLTELPRKTEQTIYCELTPRERKRYDALRNHYRALVAGLVDRVGFARSRIQILEALLRLRQAACHYGLVNRMEEAAGSSKLDTLVESLRELIGEGHKALVFSQFTSLLALVRRRLELEGWSYQYLDGRTRNRAEVVDQFQANPESSIFLISLKAGGVGLNLTAADYVFILDPWWNPAVEMQAIDRAHRIGQERPVFAYRLIAKDTIEERIVTLQADKRRLADAIIGEDSGLMKSMTVEDLELLLS